MYTREKLKIVKYSGKNNYSYGGKIMDLLNNIHEIGIVPVVTTAANALLAQTMITVGNNEVSAYESIAAK